MQQAIPGVANYPESKLIIIGGGIIGLLEAYAAFRAAKLEGKHLRVTIHEKNDSLKGTTTAHIVPSLTPDEILSVVPRGIELIKKLRLLFSEPGGIRVDDVPGVNDSDSANAFKSAVQEYGKDEPGHQKRTETLLSLGKLSMDLWQKIYDEADAELKGILIAANFNPCRNPIHPETPALHDGYRIDLIGVPNAFNTAFGMKNDYEKLGYKNCEILSPDETMKRDPFLTDSCMTNSEVVGGVRVWKNNAVAIWRPGGCIDTQKFLPLFYDYLKKVMGKYTNELGKVKDCFKITFNQEVEGVTYKAAADDKSNNTINGLKFFNSPEIKRNKHHYQKSDYVFCPGENVGTLKHLGFAEPEYSRFSGASLLLNIDIPADKIEAYSKFNHCMEVHREGVVLAWQARVIENKIFIGVAGTKAFYGDQQPQVNQAFAKNRNLLQLNIINSELPDIITLALGKPTKGIQLTQEDMTELENRKIARRWVGSRAVAYDGFPTIGPVYNRKGKVDNGRTTTHLGSGGASFAPAAVFYSRSNVVSPGLSEQVMTFGNSNRSVLPPSTYYSYQVNNYSEGRWHAREVDSAQFNLQGKYETLKGDHLKSTILIGFKERLQQTLSEKELDQQVDILTASEEYKVLKTGQGYTTLLFGLKTSSVIAFQKIVDEQREQIKAFTHLAPQG